MSTGTDGPAADAVVVGPFWVDVKPSSTAAMEALATILPTLPHWTPERLHTLTLMNARTKRDTASSTLRTVEFLVNSDSRRLAAVLPDSARVMHIHDEYRNRQRFHRRVRFDPFRRIPSHRVWYRDGDAWAYTTVAQLNFMAFVYGSGTMAFLQEHRACVQRRKTETTRRATQEKRAGRPRTRTHADSPPSSLVLFENE